MSEALFDIVLEPLFYDSMVTAQNGGKCRDCHLPIKGHYLQHSGGVSGGKWWAQCDRCVDAVMAKNRGLSA